jgi:protein SCO1/2
MFRYLLITVLIAAASAAAETDVIDQYDADRALDISQSAIGRTLGNHQFVDRLNRSVNLHDYAGKPLVISMIFTSCHHVCPMTTKHLAETTRAAREVLGEESFEIITIGFDTARDTPDAMRAFAREQGVDDSGWRFLSASKETIAALSDELGFIFFASPRGFDHINQVTIVGRDSIVYRQVYGITFSMPALVEPLKQLVFNRPESAGHIVSSLFDRYRLFCTVYNPASGRYEIDNSLFIQIAIGFIVVLSAAIFLWRGLRPSRRT